MTTRQLLEPVGAGILLTVVIEILFLPLRRARARQIRSLPRYVQPHNFAEPIYIVAGNLREAQIFAQVRKMSPSQWGFIPSQASMVGLRGVDLVFTGTWAQRKDAVVILELAKKAGMYIHEEGILSTETSLHEATLALDTVKG